MEDRLAQLFPDQIIKLQEYRSFVNQPERIQISSQEDVSDYDANTITTYFNFRVRLPRPALNVKSIQLARASIPQCVPNLPDTETTFWFYALPQVSNGNIFVNSGGAPGALTYTFDTEGNLYTSPGGVLVPNSKVHFDSGVLVIDGNVNSPFTFPIAPIPVTPTACQSGGTTFFWIQYTAPVLSNRRPEYLRYIRLVPSTAQPELMDNFTGGFNRTFNDYPDLLTELNNATTDDPLNGEPSNNIVGTFKFIPNLVSFSYSSRFNKFVFTGNNTSFCYLPAASDDPEIYVAALELQQRDAANTRFDFTGVIKFRQPFQLYRNLNLRLGFNFIRYPSGDDYLQMIRPIPPFILSAPGNLGEFTAYDNVAPGYGDLVFSSCCHIYTDVIGGSTVDSIAERSLLATVPLNTPNLGVGFHSLPLNNPLTKIATQLYEIYIELRTDSGQPFWLGNNAIVSLELILTY